MPNLMAGRIRHLLNNHTYIGNNSDNDNNSDSNYNSPINNANNIIIWNSSKMF